MHHHGRAVSARILLLLVVAALFAACGTSGTTPTGQGQQPKAKNLQHIFYIMMENHATDQVIGNTADAPYLNQLANTYGVALKYYGVTHPSLPNYLAAVSGDFQGIWDDCTAGASSTCKPEEFVSGKPYNGQLLTDEQLTKATNQPHLFTSKTIVDQLEAHQMSWKAYMESMPSAGFTGEFNAHKLYAQKHNPFVYFANIANNPARMRKIVPFSQFETDLSAGSVPNFVWISPNQCNDMHGLSKDNAAAEGVPQCGYPDAGLDHGAINAGDAYIATWVPKIMHSKAWTEGAAIVIAWDEDDYAGYSGCCHSPTGANGVVLGGANAPLIVISSKVSQHISDNTTPYNHYSLLAAIEKVWGLDCLANACGISDADSLNRFFL